MTSRIQRIAGGGRSGDLIARISEPPAPAAGSILYLHGFGSSQDGEKAALFRARALEAGFLFVSLDFQGHGLSGGDMLGLTLSRCLEDVARVRRAVPRLAAPISVIGSSMGALVGLWHAATAEPEGTVRGLALIAPALGLGDTLRDLLGEEAIEGWRRDGSLEVTNELGSFDLGWGFLEDLEAYSTARLAREFGERGAPALIFQGKLDDRVSWKEVAGFVEAVGERDAAEGPEIRFELLEDGDHRLIDRLDWICDASLSFLRERNP